MPGKERLMKEISHIISNHKIRILRYIYKKHELITGDNKGKIIIFDLRSGNPVYAWQAHKDEITQLQYCEENRVLISAGKDKKITVWQLPEAWIDEDIEKFEKTEIKQQKDALAMLQLQKKLTSIDHEDSDDDLNGWDFKR